MRDAQQHDTAPIFGLSVSDFAKRIGVSKSTAWQLVRAGRIKTIRIGTRRLVPSTEVARILSEAV